MPSYQINLADPQTVLRLLVCIVEQAKGKEVQVWAQDFDGMDKPKLLLVDYNRKKAVISLRATADFGSAVPVQPEAHQWARPPIDAPLERARTDATQKARQRAIPTDEELADMEEAAAARQSLAKLEEEGKAPLKIRNVK